MSVLRRIYRGETEFDFIGHKWWGYGLSAVLILIGVLSLSTRALDLGIEFEGGISWDVPAEDVSVEDTRDVVERFGLGSAKIQILGGDTIRVQASEEAVERVDREEVASALAELAGTDVDEVSINEVGPSWGEEITEKAVRALVYFLIAIAIYISLRFEWRMAVATLVAVVHDVFITVGVYSVTGFEVTPATVIAFLTILGFSLYDGIVVFDKVHANTKLIGGSGKMTYSDVLNLSMNEVLMRSLNTSITATLPVISTLVVGANLLGAVTLQEFSLALLVGLATGAYSSIFIASPILALLKEREPRYAAVRQRLASRGPLVTPAPVVATPAPVDVAEPAPGPPAPRPSYGGAIPPRPRKKKRR